jgi:hypothetical protein
MFRQILSLTGLVSCILMLISPSLLAAPINKCVDSSGKITYSDAPCPIKAKTQVVQESPKLTEQQQKDAKLRYYNDLKRANESDLRQLKADMQRQKVIAAAEQHDRECALKKIEADRRMADAASHPYDTWWRNRAVAASREYQLDCNN